MSRSEANVLERIRVLIVSGGFLPAKNYGGPVVSIDNIVSWVKQCDFWIVTRDHDWKDTRKLDGIGSGWNEYNANTKVLYLSDSEHTKKKYRGIIHDIKPHLIYIHGIYLAQMNIPMIKAAQNIGIPLLIAPRGTLNKNAMSIKGIKKYPYIFYFALLLNKKRTFFQSTSEEETRRIKHLLRPRTDHIFEIENFPSVPPQKILNHHKNKNELTCCFFARICPKKNLLGAIRILQKTKSIITYNIYGNIEDQDYYDKCVLETKKLPKNIKISFKGKYNHDSVFELMAQNDVLFFPTLSENYGHVIVEAMLSGLPIVISDQTPWNDVNSYKCGYALPLSDTEGFKKALDFFVTKDNDEFLSIRNQLKQYITCKLNTKTITDKYLNMFKSISGLLRNQHNDGHSL